MYFFAIFLLFAALCSAQQEQYQDIIVNNVVVSPGVRDCRTRYEAMKGVLDKFKRPFAVLDIGAESGYFTFKTAYEYPHAVGVMIENGYSDSWDTGDRLLELCKQNTELKNIVFLKKRISVEDLERLAECEHFDVVYALNVIHHFGKNWRRAADAIFRLADHTIVEVPPSNDRVFVNNPEIKAIEQYLDDKNGEVIARTPRHTSPDALSSLRYFVTPKTHLARKHWFYGDVSPDQSGYTIHSNFEEKIFMKRTPLGDIVRPWVPGINFITFKALSGVWPDIHTVGNALLDFRNTEHGDLMPWNIIVSGHALHPIDDDGEHAFNTAVSLMQTYAFAFLHDYDDIENYILNELYSRGKMLIRSVPTHISYGELIDKITILELKMRKTTDAYKIVNICKELAILQETRDIHIMSAEQLTALTRKLSEVNEILWDIEDRIRIKEGRKAFDEDFIQLARSVYIYNDQRASIKRAINELLGSGIVEEKIYEQYA